MRTRKDFAQVKLTAHGEQLAGDGGVLRIVTAQMHYEFKSGVATEVLRAAELPFLLSEEIDGAMLFEEVPAAVEEI